MYRYLQNTMSSITRVTRDVQCFSSLSTFKSRSTLLFRELLANNKLRTACLYFVSPPLVYNHSVIINLYTLYILLRQTSEVH